MSLVMSERLTFKGAVRRIWRDKTAETQHNVQLLHSEEVFPVFPVFPDVCAIIMLGVTSCAAH